MPNPFDAHEPEEVTQSSFAAKARDLESLRTAVVDAASVGAGLWFSYIFVLLYLGIAVGSVTHRDLFFANPVKLPFLGVDLPLTSFFSVGPILFVVVHAYVLLHFVLLAGKVGTFHRELQVQIADEDVRTNLRRQLPSNIFAQYLAGPVEVRTGVIGYMLRAIAWISLVVGPLALLVLFQLQFLPYQDVAITWGHRFALLADLVLIWLLWPSIASGHQAKLTWRSLKQPSVMAYGSTSLILVFFVFFTATLPEEFAERRFPALRFIPSSDLSGQGQYKSLHEWLFVGEVDSVARKPTSPWSNRLVLPGLNAVDYTKYGDDVGMAALPPSISLRARRFERAIFSGADLRKADFSGAILTDASFDGANLEFAILDHASMNGASFEETKLGRASLKEATMQGARFSFAGLQAVSAPKADLRGAYLRVVDLAFADLEDAKLDGASFVLSRLDGASLQRSSVSGATFQGSIMRGVYLDLIEGSAVDFGMATLWRIGLISYGRLAPQRLFNVNTAGAFWTAQPPPALSTTFHDLYVVINRYVEKETRQERLSLAAALKCTKQDGSSNPCEDPTISASDKSALGPSSVPRIVFREAFNRWLHEVCRDKTRINIARGVTSQKRLFPPADDIRVECATAAGGPVPKANEK